MMSNDDNEALRLAQEQEQAYVQAQAREQGYENHALRNCYNVIKNHGDMMVSFNEKNNYISINIHFTGIFTNARIEYFENSYILRWTTSDNVKLAAKFSSVEDLHSQVSEFFTNLLNASH